MKVIKNALRKTAFIYVFTQAGVILLFALVLILFRKPSESYSLFVGGMICVLPNLYFANKLFKSTGAQQIRRIMKDFYVGEIVKIALTILFFYISFKYLDVKKAWLFVGFIMAQMTFAVTGVVLKNKTVVK